MAGTGTVLTMTPIFHLDMDAFFVSVEELHDPSLKGKPVVVGGRPDQRGVVSAASYAARKFGVHSAMPLRTAYQLCPHAIFVDGHMERYRECSRRVRTVLESFTPLVEMASVDEAYLDMTGTTRLHGPPLLAAHKLHEAVKAQTGLNCSVGLATSRLVAKVASDMAKPNGILCVLAGQEARFLASLPVRKLPGVGEKTEQQLRQLGLRHVGDLGGLDEAFLRAQFGQWGLALAGKAQGRDAGGWFDTPIAEDEDPKSVSHEHTFSEDTADVERLEAVVAHMAEKVARRLREHQLHARTVQVKLRYGDFRTHTRAATLDHATQVDVELLEQARTLFRRHWTGAPLRLVGVQASSLDRTEGQLPLLEGERHEKWRKALEAADRMRDKYGEGSVSLAASLKGRFRERVHENPPE